MSSIEEMVSRVDLTPAMPIVTNYLASAQHRGAPSPTPALPVRGASS